MIKQFLFILLLFFSIGCKNGPRITCESEFYVLMENVAEGWSTQNTELALSSFHEDVIYMEPPNIQYYRGHTQLKPYFNALDSTHKMQFHHLWFNKNTQSGTAEYTFSYGKDTSDVGIVVVELEKGKIKFWREYQRKGPTNFNQFLQIKDKEWRWHIGNYPEPNAVENKK